VPRGTRRPVLSKLTYFSYAVWAADGEVTSSPATRQPTPNCAAVILVVLGRPRAIDIELSPNACPGTNPASVRGDVVRIGVVV
jgi:hypothetical protein